MSILAGIKIIAMLKKLKLGNFFKKTSKSGKLIRNIGAAVFGASAVSAGSGPEEAEVVAQVATEVNIVTILEAIGMVIGAVTALLAQFTKDDTVQTRDADLSPGGKL